MTAEGYDSYFENVYFFNNLCPVYERYLEKHQLNQVNYFLIFLFNDWTQFETWRYLNYDQLLFT